MTRQTTSTPMATSERRSPLCFQLRISSGPQDAQRDHVSFAPSPPSPPDSRWLSRKERDAVRDREDTLRRKKEEKRKERTVTIDLLGRRVIDDAPTVVDVYEEARLEEDRRAAEASAAAAANELASTFSRKQRTPHFAVWQFGRLFSVICFFPCRLSLPTPPRPLIKPARAVMLWIIPCWKAWRQGRNSAPRPLSTTFPSARKSRQNGRSASRTRRWPK